MRIAPARTLSVHTTSLLYFMDTLHVRAVRVVPPLHTRWSKLRCCRTWCARAVDACVPCAPQSSVVRKIFPHRNAFLAKTFVRGNRKIADCSHFQAQKCAAATIYRTFSCERINARMETAAVAFHYRTSVARPSDDIIVCSSM